MDHKDFKALRELVPYNKRELGHSQESSRVYMYLERCHKAGHITIRESLMLEVLYRSGSLDTQP